ncbi:MAG: hypothetical protein IT293_12130 [Deltaproteobacteria bacterium]|nr:hypothetical protein [Deltaproteobacteria bacterium]
MTRWWLAVAAVFAVTVSSEAGVLAPAKPSEVRILKLGDPCLALGSFALDTRVHGDGTTSAFAIPDKQVLVLDSVTWVVTGVPTIGGLCSIVLRVDTETIWSDVVTQSNPSGTCGATTALPPLVIPAGKRLCMTVGAGGSISTNGTRVHGFLTKNK